MIFMRILRNNVTRCRKDFRSLYKQALGYKTLSSAGRDCGFCQVLHGICYCKSTIQYALCLPACSLRSCMALNNRQAILTFLNAVRTHQSEAALSPCSRPTALEHERIFLLLASASLAKIPMLASCYNPYVPYLNVVASIFLFRYPYNTPI